MRSRFVRGNNGRSKPREGRRGSVTEEKRKKLPTRSWRHKYQIRERSQEKLKMGHKNHSRSHFSQNPLELVESTSANDSHKMQDRTAIVFFAATAPASVLQAAGWFRREISVACCLVLSPSTKQLISRVVLSQFF